jgi:threonine dehydrogenase-like Zn-dependent dehydrogenase
MKAIAITPGEKNSARLIDIDKPKVSDIKDGRGVLVQMLKAGACGTDREINNAEYGTAPAGSDYLILGHENLGRVVETSENVTEFETGDLVVATVRRPCGTSIYDLIGQQDFTTDNEYYEHGISRLHGFWTEFYVEDADFLAKIPPAIADIAVLLEPLSIIEKGFKQAKDIQLRLDVWHPKKAAVLGTGNVGLLTVLALRRELSVKESVKKYGEYDVVFEATGYSPIVFEAMQVLAENGVLILSSVTGGERTTENVPSDLINQRFVLGNRAMVGTVNANREHFKMGVRDLALAEAMYAGWLERMITHRVEGLENFERVFDILENGSDNKAIKAIIEISDI